MDLGNRREFLVFGRMDECSNKKAEKWFVLDKT